jgi:UDP:flavonoid glycosyltransferase YjiC (YdhE family)
MRALLLSTPFVSHVAPLIPLAWALRAAGHEVIVAGQPDVADGVRAAGLCGAPIGERYGGTEMMALHLPPDTRPLQVMGPGTAETAALEARAWRRHAEFMLPPYLEFARSWRPDLIISEQLEFAGVQIGERLGVPVVRHRWFADPYGEHLAGLPEPDLTLDPCPCPAPGDSSAASRVQAIRPVPWNGTGPPPAGLEPTTTRDHRVCVSLGNQTLALNGMPLLRGIVAAFSRLPGVEAVVTVDEAYRAGLGPVAGNVTVIPPTPLVHLLDGCDAIVHHAGAGTALTATVAGLPQLVLPQLADQFANAGRLVAAGVAVSVATAEEQDDPAVLADRLRDLLDEPAAAAAAARLADAVRTMPSPIETTRRLERLGSLEVAGRRER